MAALGLSSEGQFALATTIYTTLRSVLWLPGEPQTIIHTVMSSTTHPTKFMGRGPATLEGELKTTGTLERAFITAVQTETLRHASWKDTDGTEVYVHVYAGTITSRRALHRGTGAAGTGTVLIGFKFLCPDQRLYKASDDSVLLGG